MTAWLATGGAMGATGIEAAEIGDDGLAAPATPSNGDVMEPPPCDGRRSRGPVFGVK